MDWNARTDQKVASVNFSERQQYLPQGSTTYAYVQSQQAPLPAQNVSNYPSRIQEDCLYPKLNTVAPLIPNNCYGTSNQLSPLARASDMPTHKISNTVCSENTYPQNSQTAGLMKEPLVYQQIITKVSPLPASNSSQIALQSQPSSGNVQMHQVTANQLVQTSSNGGQHTNLPVMVSCTSLPNQQGTTSSNKMCLVWVPHQNYNQPLTQQFQKQSTPLRPINTHLQSQLRAGIPNAPCQNNPVLLQPKQQYRSAPPAHMLQNSPVSQQCAAVLPQPVNMQLPAHQTMAFHNSQNQVTFANPTVTVSQGQSQKSIILPQRQQLYKGTKANVNLQNVYPPDFFSNSTSQPVQCQPPPRTQPVNVKNYLVLDEPKLLETISPNLNVSITDSDLKKAQMASCESSKSAKTVVPFNHRYFSGSTALKDVGILQNMCKSGQETQTSGFPLGEKFTVTLNTLQPPASTPDCSVELSNCANGSDQPVNFTTSVKDTPVLTEDDMIREVQNLLRAKEDFLNLVKDFKEKRKIYRSLKSHKDSPSNVKCTRTANKLNCMQETQVEPKVPDNVANLTSLLLQPSVVLAEQQKIDQHKRVEEKTNVCTDSTDSSQRNNQYILASQKVAKDPEILTYMPAEKQNYLFNKANSQLKEMTAGNQNSSKLSEATTTVQTLSQEHIVVSPSIKKDRSPVLAELITEVINSYSKLTETQSCFPKSSEKPNDAVHTNKNDQFSNMVCSISHASTSDVSTLRDANLKEGTVMHSLTEDESYQLGNNLTEVLKSCAGMWKVPTSVRKMESKQLPSTNEDLKQTLSTPEICDQNSLHLENFQQTLAASKTVTSINVNDTSRTVAGSSSTMVKAFEPQVAIVNPLRLFKSESTVVHPENKCATIEVCPVGQEASISRVLGGVSSGAQNPPRSNLHSMFGATALDASLLSANDQSEMVTLGGSSIGNINLSESVQSLQTEKIMQCPDVPNHPKSPDVLCYEHEIQELFKAQPSHTCEGGSVPQQELNKNGSSVICIDDAVDEQLKISSFCTLVEGNTLYDSQIAQMFDGGISTSCKTSQRESVGLITPALLESNDPNTTQVSNTAQQGLTDQPFFNRFSEGVNEHHSFGSDKVFLKISEHNSDSAQTTPDSCNKERQPDEKNELVKHPCVTSETEDGHFRNKEQKEYVPFTHIQMCTPNSERPPDSDQDIHVQNDCVLPEYYLEDDTLNILSAQSLNDQLSEVPFTHRLVSKPNLEIQTPSDQDIYIEKDDCVIPVNTFNIFSVQCLSDQLSELQQEFPYGFERLESILSLKTSLVNQKAFNERGNVDEEECLRKSNCNSSSPDIYCPMKADSTNFVIEHYSESKPMMRKNCNEYCNSNELDNLNDGCDPSQLTDLQLDDGNISTIDVCDSDMDDFVKQIKITVLDSEQMNKLFPEMPSQCVTNDNIQCSQWNMQSDKNIENKVSLTNLNSDNPSVILQTDVEENCSSSNEKQFCCLYRWLSSDYGSAPKCSCLTDDKTDDAASNLECKDTDAKVVDNMSSGNGGIIYLSTESSDEDDNLTIDYQDQKRQNMFATSTDIKQIKAFVKTSPTKTKNGCAEQKLKQPLHIAQSEMKPLPLQDKGCLAQPAANNISSKTDIELNLKGDTCKTDHCKEGLHSTDSVVEGTSNNVIKDFRVEERGKKLDNLSMSPKSKNERLIVKTDFLKSTKCADVRQEVIDGKACDLSDTSDEELQKKKSKQNGEQFKNRIFESTKTSKKNMDHKEPDLGFNSNEEHNTKTRRNSFPPSTPLHITAAKITVAHEWSRTFNLSDPSEEENEEVEYILADCSQAPSEEQPGSEANASIIPRRKLTNVVKVPSKKRFPGKRMCRETVEPQCATSNISDVKYPSKYHTKNVLTKKASTIRERFQHVRACLKSERTKKIKACPSVKNVNIPNLDTSKHNAICFGENLSSDNMEKVLPACRGIPLNSMTSKSYPPYKSKQNVDSLSSKQFKSNQLHVRRGSDSNMSIANENAQGQGAEGSKLHYLNRVAFTSTSSERIHLRKLEFGISPSKLGGGRQSSKPFEATDLRKPLRVAVSQNAAEKSQMLEFKLCPEVLLSCSSVDESTNDNTLFDPEKNPVEGIRSRKEDWLKNIPLKKRKVDMTKFQAENPLLDSPIFLPNTSPVEVAKQPAPGSKSTFHAFKRLYLEKRSKSLNITPGK